MGKKRSSPSEPNSSETPRRATVEPRKDGTRDVIESIVIAFILAFMFRTFEAEAFVIPTGSMAPTLMGRHREIQGPDGSWFQVGASDEIDRSTGAFVPRREVYSTTSPLYGQTIPTPQSQGHYSYSGDRILVSKIAYLWKDPERWDVVVFKFPHGANENYIKRLVGKPGEGIRIFGGDVYARPAGESEFEVARKDPRKTMAMLQIVHDNDYQSQPLRKIGWPTRWTAENKTGWKESSDGKSFSLKGSNAPAWLRYQHTLPTWSDWEDIRAGKKPAAPSRRLIKDLCHYNTGNRKEDHFGNMAIVEPPGDAMGRRWVGDLAMECELQVESAGRKPEARLELVKGGLRFQCRINLQTGVASLWKIDPGVPAPMKPFATSLQPTALRGKSSSRKLRFSNVDCQLRLWVDGKVIAFDKPTTYSPWRNLKPRQADFAPAGVALQDAQATVDHMKIFRDIYYYADGYEG
ncbi:MAG: signal peptidase I, partial [Planctomycetales bacterium]